MTGPNRTIERLNLCFLLSGFCSLLYQTVWLRQAIAKFGVNAPIIASVLSAFMVGLAVGNLFGARYQAWLQSRGYLAGLRGYAVLELIISAGGLAVPALMSWGASAILSVPMANETYFVFSFLIILIVLVPFCAAMGATLPVALSFTGDSEDFKSSSAFSRLYFANVSGAIYGAVLPTFIAIELMGFQKTVYLAVAANWLIAILVWNLSPEIRPSKEFAAGSSTKSFLAQKRWVLCELFLLGMASLALEVVWTKLYVFFAGAVVYAFAFILAIYLAFTALGTNFYRRFLERGNFVASQLWIFMAPAALLVLASVHPAFDVPPIVRILVGVAPISFLLGVITPSLIDQNTASSPGKVSIAYTFNLAGCIAGPLLAGFLIIPAFGTRVALYLVALDFLILSLVHQYHESRRHHPQPIPSRLSVAGALALSVMIVALDKPFESQFDNAQVLYDHTATVIAAGSGMEKRLMVDGTHMTSLNVMTKMFAHVPLAFLGREPEEGVVICFGMGTTFRSMTTWRIRTTAVELVPSVPRFFPFFFKDAERILETPDVEVLVDDGRRFLSRGNEQFDVIVADPPPPVESVSSGLLYSTDFYEIVKKRLKKDGVFGTIILDSDSQNLFSMVAALKESFAHVRMFEPYGEHNILQIVASQSPIPMRNAEELTGRMSMAARDDLEEWNDSSPDWFPKSVQGKYEWFLAHEIDIPDFLAKHQPAQRISLTDDKPVNEYFFLRRTFGGGGE